MAPPLILQIEDNLDDRQLLRLALQSAQIESELICCGDGEEALRFLATRFERTQPAARPLPQLVLLDLNLPKVDGFEVLRHIRATSATRLLPVVVLSSSREERDLLDSYRLGANSYIRKPIEFERFVETTRRICDYWLTLNEHAPNAL